MRRSATHILRVMGTRTDDRGCMYIYTPEKLYFTKIIKGGRGHFAGRAGTLNKYFFIWPKSILKVLSNPPHMTRISHLGLRIDLAL